MNFSEKDTVVSDTALRDADAALPEIPPEEPLGWNASRARMILLDSIGYLGEILVTAGIIVGLFAVWQLFITDVQVSGQREQVTTQFLQTLPEIPNQVSEDERTDDPPAWDSAPGFADTLGTLHVPRWDYMIIPVQEGTDHSILDMGSAGHYAETALPGEVGNFSVAAHRRSFGSNFRYIHTLEDGDVVVMQTSKAWLVYKKYTHEIVLPTAREVIYPVPGDLDATPTKRLMTMTTCNPEYGNSERYIVHLELDHWVPIESGIPKELWKG